MIMDILQELAIWKENEEYQKIIDTLESLDKRTPELDSELGCVYNIIAGDNKACYQRALDLLLPHEEYFKNDHNWNYRVGYAYFNLEQEGLALNYFNAALNARPGDEDTLKFIDDATKILSLPRFDRPFRVRVEECWKEFEIIESKIRDAIDNNNSKETFLLIGDVLNLAFNDISFDAGKTKDKYILVLSPQGDKTSVYTLQYFAKHCPESLKEIWTIKVGRNASNVESINFGGSEISLDEIVFSVLHDEGNHPILAIYSEKLIPLLVSEPTITYMLMESILYKVIGELATLVIIDKVLISNEVPEDAITLTELGDYLEAFGVIKNMSLESYISTVFTEYTQDPVENRDANWRYDIVAGTTGAETLIDEYNQGSSYTMDILNSDGIVAGFLCLPIEAFTRENDKLNLVAFIEELKNNIRDSLGEDYVTFIGEAGGLYTIYIDFIAWDLPPLVAAIREYLAEKNISDAVFQTFRQNANSISLNMD